jgi:competence protein ComGF
MQKKEMNHFVSTGFQNNEKGFTFIHLLIAITILSIFLPFLGYLLNAAAYNNNYSEISVQQFFQYLRNEVIQAVDYRVRPSQSRLFLELENGGTATIEQYGSLIRRQVNGTGHEVYLRNVAQVDFSNIDYGFQISITTSEGEFHEKSFVFYE